MKHFKKNEFSDYNKMDKGLLEFLDKLRDAFGKPIHINSSYRTPEDNERVGGVKNSEHLTGEAVDIRCDNSRDRFLLVSFAIGLGCNRIGIGDSFIHLGWSKTKSQRVIWTY